MLLNLDYYNSRMYSVEVSHAGPTVFRIGGQHQDTRSCRDWFVPAVFEGSRLQDDAHDLGDGLPRLLPGVHLNCQARAGGWCQDQFDMYLTSNSSCLLEMVSPVTAGYSPEAAR